MSKQTKILSIVIIVLIASNIFFAAKYFLLREEFNQVKAIANAKNTNEKALNFTKLFVAEVLKADGEVDFETRLKLENAVRELNNDEILSQWQKFIESETEEDAQVEVKNLLEMLIKEIE